MEPRHPNAEIPDLPRHLIDDEATARGIAVYYGLEGQLRQAGFTGDTTTAVVEDHPTHWLLVARFWGREDPEENGHSVLAFRKRDFSRLDVETVVLRLHGGGSGLTVRRAEETAEGN